MVSFRFHLLSLTAVFLALALGIAIGATVVDRATVDALQTRLDNVEARVRSTDARNDELRGDLNEWGKFVDQGGDALVAGRLSGVHVLVLGVRGFEKGTMEHLRQSLAAAGAELDGTLWFTSRLRLEKADDTVALSQILGLENARPDDLRRAVVTRLATAWAAKAEPNPVPALLEDAFVEFEPPPAVSGVPPVVPASLPRPDTHFVLASGPKPDVPNDQLAVPLALQFSQSFPSRLLAVEPGGRDAPVTGFVPALRQNQQAATLLSTVDNLGDYRGQVAAVLALADLTRGKVGHYGVEGHASRLVPESSP